jgi:hypothetical protein
MAVRILAKLPISNCPQEKSHEWPEILMPSLVSSFIAQILLRSLDSGKLEKVPKRQGMSASTKAIKSVQGEWSGKAL